MNGDHLPRNFTGPLRECRTEGLLSGNIDRLDEQARVGVRQAQNATAVSSAAGAFSSDAENTRWISFSFSSSSSKVMTVTSLAVGLVPTMTMHWIEYGWTLLRPEC